MSSFWFVSLESGRAHEGCNHLDGSAIAQEFGDLDAAAAEMGIRPLSDFLSATGEQITEFLAGVSERERAELRRKVKEEWFDPSDALRTVRACLHRWRADAAAFGEDTNPVIEDLEAICLILEEAEKYCVRFHFSADPG